MRACVVCGCEVPEAGQGGHNRAVCSALCGERRDRDYQARYYRENTVLRRRAVREMRALANEVAKREGGGE